MAEFVRLEVADGVGTIRVDRPKMNALSIQVQREIGAAAVEAGGARRRARPWWSTAGERTFAAGADVKEMADMSHADMVAASAGLQEEMRKVAAIPKPVVAAVTGYALGGGCELALCADVRFAADDATLGQPEVLLGVIPGMGGTQRLSRLVGPSRAKDLIFTGRFVKADEALALGMVDRVVPADRGVRRGAGLGRPVRRTPRRTRSGWPSRRSTRASTATSTRGLALEAAAFAELFGTEDRATGMASFVENGPGKATFVGR